jgi:ribosomal protein S18 acetylase RimI-like enzyme
MGNAFAAYGERLPAGFCRTEAVPSARGEGVTAEQAMPLYVRDKVAQTTTERAHAKAAQLDQSMADLLLAASPHPWSAAQIASSRAAGHRIHSEFDTKTKALVAVAIVLPGVDESELLNLAVASSHRRQGIAQKILQNILSEGAEKSHAFGSGQPQYRGAGAVPQGGI